MWFITALGSALGMGIYALMARTLLKNKADSLAFTLIIQLSCAILILPLSLLENGFFHLDLRITIIILALTAIYAVVDSLLVRARQLEEASHVAVVMRIGSVWALLNGALFYHEAITLTKILGISLIIIGGILAVWQKSKFRLSTGIIMIVVATLLYSLGSLIDKYIVTSVISPGFYKPITWAASAFWVFSYMRWDTSRVIKEYALHGPKIFLVAVFASLYSYLAAVSYQLGEISKVGPIISLSTIITVIGGIIFLGETTHKWHKLVGAALALSGALLLR